MLNYKNLNNVIGWLIFLVAATVYTLTVEPTASFWDCGEFIACSYKLQVPHPPGSPTFLLVGRMFSFLAMGDVEQVAFWVNMVSVMASAFTILFLFWTITILVRKLLVNRGEDPTMSQSISILASGIIGGLAYTFSDTFWFSAVEAEVYALSSFFTAIVFWAMLKWEQIDNSESMGNKWLLFIAYLIGLSIGVHLLNLVALPALALIYYYKRYTNHSWQGALIAFTCGLIAVGVIQVGIIPGLPAVAGKFEIAFVNSIGLPFGSGIIFFVTIFLGSIVAGIWYAIKSGKVLLHTGLLSLLFILIGYSSYMIIPIRSTYNPPLDENDPEEVMSFVSYLKREQYGDRPLLYGPTIKSRVVEQEEGDPKYRKKGDEYIIYDYKINNIYDDDTKMLLPRIHSTQQNHKNMYSRWVKIPANKKNADGTTRKIVPITQGTNMKYLFSYQMNFMFWRYFFWNFSGRAHDRQDAERLYPWDTMQKDKLPFMMANSKARNQFYMLPFFLGLIGVAFGLMRSGKISLILGVLFFFTGIGIIIFLNQPPVEPRERDYTYAGAFYVFAIWIGLGVAGMAYFIGQVIKNKIAAPALAFVLSLIVPVLMAKDGWDDHDRSSRYFSVDSAKNLLESCAPNAIIFTGGDNDTFPLWYVQEVEGFRDDVRVCNLSLLNTDWYINLMKQDAYDSKALPITMQYEEYIQGTNDYLPFVADPRVGKSIDIGDFIKLIRKKDNPLQRRAQSGKKITTFPSKVFTFPIDKQAIIDSGIVPKAYESKILDRITWNIGRGGLEKKHLIMLDMIEQNQFKRPIYFSTTISSRDYLNLENYFQLEGLAYRFLPVNNGSKSGRIATEIMYDNMVKKFHWRNLDDPTVFYDENYQRFPANTRDKFYRLASEYYNQGARLNNEGKRLEQQATLMEQANETEMADSTRALATEKMNQAKVKQAKSLEVVDFSFKVMPDTSIPYDATISSYVDLLIKLEQKDRALDIMEKMIARYKQSLDYYSDKRNKSNGMFVEPDVRMAMYGLNRFASFERNFKDDERFTNLGIKGLFEGYVQSPTINDIIPLNAPK